MPAQIAAHRGCIARQILRFDKGDDAEGHGHQPGNRARSADRRFVGAPIRHEMRGRAGCTAYEKKQDERQRAETARNDRAERQQPDAVDGEMRVAAVQKQIADERYREFPKRLRRHVVGDEKRVRIARGNEGVIRDDGARQQRRNHHARDMRRNESENEADHDGGHAQSRLALGFVEKSHAINPRLTKPLRRAAGDHCRNTCRSHL